MNIFCDEILSTNDLTKDFENDLTFEEINYNCIAVKMGIIAQTIFNANLGDIIWVKEIIIDAVWQEVDEIRYDEEDNDFVAHLK